MINRMKKFVEDKVVLFYLKGVSKKYSLKSRYATFLATYYLKYQRGS